MKEYTVDSLISVLRAVGSFDAATKEALESVAKVPKEYLNLMESKDNEINKLTRELWKLKDYLNLCRIKLEKTEKLCLKHQRKKESLFEIVAKLRQTLGESQNIPENVKILRESLRKERKLRKQHDEQVVTRLMEWLDTQSEVLKNSTITWQDAVRRWVKEEE